MRPQQLILRGYTVPDGDSYFSICLDLNIYARGDTVEQATERLFAFVREYLNEALTDDKEHAVDLIPRRAPLYFWLRYRLLQLEYQIWKLRHKNGDDRRNRGGPFERPLPVLVGC
jgi:hypothetical protein